MRMVYYSVNETGTLVWEKGNPSTPTTEESNL